MKTIVTLVLVFICSIGYTQNCKVKIKAISGNYKGDCKKGKAHGKGTAIGKDAYTGEFKNGVPNGKGTYTWGESKYVYEGDWKKGEMHGAGKMFYKDKDSIVTGFWKKNKYVGLFEKPYIVNSKTNLVHQLNLKRYNDPIPSLRLYFKNNDTRVTYPQADVIVTSGEFKQMLIQRNFIELTNITFPLAFKAIFNKEQINVKILESGLWHVNVEIREIIGLKQDKQY